MLSLFCNMIKIIETNSINNNNRIITKEIKVFSKTIYYHSITSLLEENNYKKSIGYETKN